MKCLFASLLLFALILPMQMVNAQDLKTEVYVKEHIPNKKPVPYPYVREADVIWSRTIWRMIDLREKQNMPLYYPVTPIGNRMSLMDLLLWGIDNEGLTAYSPDDPLNEFKIPLNREGVDLKMGAGSDTMKIMNPATGMLEETIIESPRRSSEVKKVLVKEKWYFDKQHSVMKVRIIGMCPIRVFYKLDDNQMPTDELTQIQTFWVYYPEARNLMARYEIYNRHNDAQRISFDDFFWQRRFNSYIFAESNVYNNRKLIDYTSGYETLLEGERIKKYLFELEHDLWEY
ncbi:gliding motility protein GldN [Bacteroidales bacterium]|nr:gliding motility protein GldN [Bacteroidales bacterium]